MRPVHPLVTTHPDFIGPRIPISAKRKAHRLANKEKVAAMRRRSYLKNIESIKAWKEKNRESIREYHREYKARRLSQDPQYAVSRDIRSRVRKAIRGASGVKSKSCQKLLGCSHAFAMAHIEAQFLPGMTWGNRKEWHIDHIIPVAAFDLTDPEHQSLCFHYTNLRPLWAVDNIRKGDNITPEVIAIICKKMESVETDGPFCAIAE